MLALVGMLSESPHPRPLLTVEASISVDRVVVYPGNLCCAHVLQNYCIAIGRHAAPVKQTCALYAERRVTEDAVVVSRA